MCRFTAAHEPGTIAGVPAFTRRINVSAPVERVFDFVIDLDHVPDWMPNVHRIEKLTHGPITQGTRLRETREHRGRVRTTDLEVLGFDPPRLYRVGGGSMGITMTFTFRLHQRDHATEVELETEVDARWFAKPIARRIFTAMEQSDDDVLERFQRAMELGQETKRLD
jgi:uncharacterized membrane protein